MSFELIDKAIKLKELAREKHDPATYKVAEFIVKFLNEAKMGNPTLEFMLEGDYKEWTEYLIDALDEKLKSNDRLIKEACELKVVLHLKYRGGLFGGEMKELIDLAEEGLIHARHGDVDKFEKIKEEIFEKIKKEGF